MKTPLMTVTSSHNGRTFAVRYLPAGAMTAHAHPDKPVVEFYDTADADDGTFGPLGQFVSYYFVGTLLKSDSGLLLDGGSPAVWSVDAEAMTTVREWLRATEATTTGANDA